MKIKILGQGCAKCKQLYDEVTNVVQELQVQAEIVKVENIKEIVSYGVMRTPALVINEEVKVTGKIPSVTELAALIKAAQ